MNFPPEFQRYRVFGVSRFSKSEFDPTNITDITMFYCLDEQEGNQLVKISLHPGKAQYGFWYLQFLNTSLMQFAEFLCLMKEHEEWKEAILTEYRAAPEEMDIEKVYSEHGKQLGPRFHRADAPACEEETGWWEAVFFIENGWLG